MSKEELGRDALSIPPASAACSPPSRYPGLGAGRSQLYPIFISHIVATGKWIPSPRQASQLPLPPVHCPALHPLGTEGLGQWGFPRVDVSSVSSPAPTPPIRALDTPPSALPLLRYPVTPSLPVQSHTQLGLKTLGSCPGPGDMTSH